MLQDGWAPIKARSLPSSPPTPSPSSPSESGVHVGANRTGKPASRTSSASVCNGPAGAGRTGCWRVALVSRVASASAAAMVRERSTFSRAEPRSASERARISPSNSRVPAPSSVSRTERRAPVGRIRSVGFTGTSSALLKESFALNSTRPAERVATVPAGSPVGRTAASRGPVPSRPRAPPVSLSVPPSPRAWRPGLRWVLPALPYTPRRSRRTGGGDAGDGS
jgi:hypothetical protein